MDLNEIANRMQEAFGIEDEFLPTEITVHPVRGGGTAYLIDRGVVEFSRGTVIDAYVYIEYPDGDNVAERLTVPGEVELWTVHLR